MEIYNVTILCIDDESVVRANLVEEVQEQDFKVLKAWNQSSDAGLLPVARD